MFNIKNKDFKIELLTLNIFYIFSGVSVVDFEQVNISWF